MKKCVLQKRYTSLREQEGTELVIIVSSLPAPAPTEMKRRPHLRGDDDDDASPLAGTYFVFSILAAYAAPSSFRRKERKEEEEEHIVTYTIPSDRMLLSLIGDAHHQSRYVQNTYYQTDQ